MSSSIDNHKYFNPISSMVLLMPGCPELRGVCTHRISYGQIAAGKFVYVK